MWTGEEVVHMATRAHTGRGKPGKSLNLEFHFPGLESKVMEFSVGCGKSWKIMFIKNGKNELGFCRKENGKNLKDDFQENSQI